MTSAARVVAGIDTHADTIHVAVITDLGQPVADREFPTTAIGYRNTIAFLAGHGEIVAVGVEGTSSYGAGITTALTAAGMTVLEVTRPCRADRRRLGKSDPIDAYQAARAVLSGHTTSTPKGADTGAIRALHNARRSAVKARTAALNQITHMLITAPEQLRAKYRSLRDKSLIDTLARCRPGSTDPTTDAVLTAMKVLAQRCQFLTSQVEQVTSQLDALTTAANPALRAALGVGPDTAAQFLVTAGANPDRLRTEASFAALCGAAPVQASSGKTRRHRLSKGGDRSANNALHRVALVRMSCHPATRDYVARQRAAGKSTPEILRQLKRAIAREIFRLLTQNIEIPDYRDLRPARQAKNITLTAAANHLGVWPTAISRLERGLTRHDTLAHDYRNWLNAA